MGSPLIDSLKAEKLFSTLKADPRAFKAFVIDLCKLICSSYPLQTAQGTQLFKISGFVDRMGILLSKLTACLPLACPRTMLFLTFPILVVDCLTDHAHKDLHKQQKCVIFIALQGLLAKFHNIVPRQEK